VHGLIFDRSPVRIKSSTKDSVSAHSQIDIKTDLKRDVLVPSKHPPSSKALGREAYSCSPPWCKIEDIFEVLLLVIEEHFVNIPNAQMGQLCRSRRERTLQADVHAHNSGSTNYLAEACVLFPQSRASYATRVYNRQPREAGLPSPCLSPTLAELMLTRTRAKYTRHAPAAQHSRAYTSRRPTRERAPR
jgi:hypothetical protein